METLPVRLIRSAALWLQRPALFPKSSISGGILLAGWLLCQVAISQELPKAIDLLPASTQAFTALPKSSEFIKNWRETQLGQLADDERMKDFWSNQQEELRRRLAAAGWQLSLKIEDLENLCSGQAALGLISRPEVTEKPFSLALIVDVADRAEELEKFFQRVGIDMESQKGVLKKIDANGVEVKHYSIPKLSADGRARDSYFAVSKNQLLISDDLRSIQELIEAQSNPREDSLAKSELYTKIQQRIVRDEHTAEIEYFVKPLGLGKLLRSISAQKGKKQVDLLKLLEDQGFGSILAAAGSVQLAKEDLDMHHQGFVLREEELPESVQILDFPNQKALVPPPWISAGSASVMGFSWNFTEAFPKLRGIVDAYIGDAQFDEILEQIKNDPQGPQIDIRKEILPHIGQEFYTVTEIIEPITPDSKRSLICIKLNDPENKLYGVLNRYSKSEPGSSIEDVGDYRIWKFSNDEEEEEVIEFNNPGNKNANEEDDEEKPLLNKWGVCIVDGYFVFASNPESLVQVIENAKNQAIHGDFEKLSSVQSVRAMQEKLLSAEGQSFSEIDLADRSAEMQYELFRQGILPQSRSLMAIIAERILKTDKSKPQEFQGSKLPPYEQVKHFFTPRGFVVRSEKDGWGIDAFILGKKPVANN
ncbi:MAG: hypothetical protein LW850_21565 [Planctomycetaceae bacterium]|nr:hypothetical protein [Planctomycetaceae bacterium]MCE2812984.1 hypothetical protein [Planctomycetaceae bacterium]